MGLFLLSGEGWAGEGTLYQNLPAPSLQHSPIPGCPRLGGRAGRYAFCGQVPRAVPTGPCCGDSSEESETPLT